MAGKWAIAACLRRKARFLSAPGQLLGAAFDRLSGGHRAAASTRGASDANGWRRSRLRSEHGWTLTLPGDVPAGWLAELMRALVMELSADAIWLATAAVDMRTGIDGLSLHVQQALGRAPCDGTAYVFANRRRTRLKLVCWDGTGVWMCLRRLHRGQFVWPQADEACWQMSAEQWQWLVAGVDWQRLSAPAPAQWRL